MRKDTGAVDRIGSSEVPQRISGMIQVAGPKPPYDDDEWWAKREQEAVYARMRAAARAEREEYAQTGNVPFEDSVPTNAAIDAAGMPWSNAYREFVSIYRMTPEEHLASVGID